MGNAGSMVTHLAKQQPQQQQHKLIDIPSRCLITQQILQMSRTNIGTNNPIHLRYNEMHSPDTKVLRCKDTKTQIHSTHV